MNFNWYYYFTGVDFSPVNDSGYFVSDDNHIYPKEFKVNLNFTVLHTKVLGWTSNGFAQGAYPYPIVKITEEQQTAQAGKLADGELSPVDVRNQGDADTILAT